jgi:hypothetical protein
MLWSPIVKQMATSPTLAAALAEQLLQNSDKENKIISIT